MIGFRIKEFFSIEKGDLLKLVILFVALYYLVWDFAGLGNYVRKQLYGVLPEEGEITLENAESIQDYYDTDAGSVANIKGYWIYKTFRKKYAVAGTFVRRMNNKDFLGYTKPKLDEEDKMMYMTISPESVTVVLGSAASALKQCDFDQPTNSYVKCPKDFDEKVAYINNYHIIPANKSVAVGIRSLPKRAVENIYMEGYLMDWDFINKDDNLRFQTALKSGETISHELETEVKLRKHFQLYLTRMVYDGYEFK